MMNIKHLTNKVMFFSLRVIGRSSNFIQLLVSIGALTLLNANSQTKLENVASIPDQESQNLSAGDTKGGIKYWSSIISTLEKDFGLNHPETILVLEELAKIYITQSQYNAALDLQLRIYKARVEALGEESPETLIALRNLALTHSQLGQHKDALIYNRRLFEVRLRINGAEHTDTVQAMGNLAADYRALALHDEALPLKIRVLEIREKTHGSDHILTAIALGNLALTYSDLERHQEALKLQVRALSIYERLAGAEHLDTGLALGNLGTTYVKLARYEEALTLQRRALVIIEANQGPTHHLTAQALGNLGYTYSELGQFEQVLPLQRRALDIFETVFGSDHPETANAIGNLAATYGELGQDDLALPLNRRVLAIQDKVLGPNHPATALALGNLALNHAALYQYEEALPLQIRELSIQEEILGPHHRDTAIALGSLASTYFALSQYDLALNYQHRVLGILDRDQYSNHPVTAEALGDLALTYVATSQQEIALPFQRRSLQILYSTHGPEHPKIAAALNNLAITHLSMGNTEIATGLLKTAVNTYQTTRERVSQIGTAELRSYTESVARTYQRLASVLTDQGRLAEAQMVLDMLKEDEQFDFIRRSAGADPRRTRIGYTPTEERWMSRYREIADRLAALGREEQALQKQAKLVLSEEEKKRQAALAADLRVAQTAFESFLEQMRQEFAARGSARSVEFAESSVKALAELQDLLKGLGDDVALLQIYLTDEQVNFLITTPGVQLARNVKIKTQDLNRQVAELNRLLRDPKADPLPAAQALYKLLLAPVEQDLQQAGAKTVMLSLDGVLRYLPFGVLHDGQRYALQRWNLPVYTSVVRERLREAANANWQAAGLGVTRKHGNFDPLPAVRTEMSSIIRTGATGVLPGEVHLDEAFTAQRLKDVSQRRFPVVHVASHFQFSPGTEINSFLLLGDGTQLTLGDIRTQNYRFDDVDLLTLSACDTGLGGGRDQRGREIEGFGVIAQQQGAKAVLATLWKVADSSTATLMGDMYRRRVQGGLSKIEALRQAQMSMAAQPRTAHPFYWAPFVLMGNWK
jgi:CHAT domain-containing protein